MKKVFFLLLIILLNGCYKDPYSRYDGQWLLVTIEFSDKEQLKYFHVNSILFAPKKKEVSVPGSLFAERDLHADWEIIYQSDTMDSININSKNIIFNKKFKVTFSDSDERKFITLESDSIFIKGYNAFR